jgi:hypothetical protein
VCLTDQNELPSLRTKTQRVASGGWRRCWHAHCEQLSP